MGSQTMIQQDVETRFRNCLPGAGTPGPAPRSRRHKRRKPIGSTIWYETTAEQARMKQDAQVEEQRLQRLMAAMPEAFSYTYDGMTDGNLRLYSFPIRLTLPRPTRLASITAWRGRSGSSRNCKRLVKIDAHIMTEIDFGYGLFGRVEKGGSFQIERAACRRKPLEDQLSWTSTSPGAWSSSKPSTRINARCARDFQPVPPTLGSPGQSHS